MDQKPIYASVLPPHWSEVWIIGRGPSANDFDWTRLQGKQILAVNDAIFRVLSSEILISSETAVALFSLDNQWIRRHRDFLNKFTGEKYFALPLETWPDCGNISGAKYLQWAHEDGLNDNSGFINTGCHSGYGALNLAWHKKASVIHLVGFDLNPAVEDQYYYWALNFNTVVKQFQERGTFVLNHSILSHITAFPKVA